MQSIIFLLLAIPTFATFLASDLPGPFLRRRGSACPTFLEIAHSSSDPPQFSQVLILDRACTAGKLQFDATEDVLSRYLSGVPEIGKTLSLFVEEALECPGVTFQPGAVFTFVKSSKDVEIDFSRAFGRNGTDVAAEGKYTFVDGGETLVIGNRCLYTRMTEEEFDRQRGECFPRNAVVATRRGMMSMEDVNTGEIVYDGNGWTRVIGWTHSDSRFRGSFVRIGTSVGTVTLSRGHYIYADGGLLQARDVRVGMRVPGGVVTDVDVVIGEGLYNLQTASGDVVVDGLRCSTYTSSVDPVVAHALLAPVRIAISIGVDLLKMVGFGAASSHECLGSFSVPR